jgi:hypothetical protein
MKQFTSNIDFSLTKKRFRMMLKEFSFLRTGSKGIFLLPILFVSTLMFCTTNSNTYPHNLSSGNDELYTNVDLYLNPPRSEELNIEKRGMGIRYDSDGNPFTGTQEFRFVKNDSLFNEIIYENGIMKSSVAYDNEGNALDRFEYGYIGDQFKMVKHIKPNGMVVEEWRNVTPGELGYHKKLHSNGQLKYEAYFEENIEYEGLMTLYNETGEVIERGRYEDGELIEKIK